MSSEDTAIYEFLIFNAKLKLIYYRNFSQGADTVYDYQRLSTDSRIMNTIGTAIQVSRISQSFSPTKDMIFRCFRTNQYKFNMFQTANDMRFIIFSSLKEQTIEFSVLFTKLFEYYIDYVKRNYLYEQDAIIDIPKFKQATNALFKEKQTQSKKK